MSVVSHTRPAATRILTGRLSLSVPVAFTTAAFLAAFLLFLIQPMVGKMVLPRFGGAPAVWNTCQLFFQVGLLTGYAYAHLSVVRLGVKRQIVVHLGLLLLPLLVLPIGIPDGWGLADDRPPLPTLIGLLAVAAALPFCVVSSTAPLLQRWYAETGRPSSADPYFLYAASNLGSLVALLGYPTLIEPNFALTQQSQVWTAGFVFLAALLAGCGMVVWWAPRPRTETAPTPATPARTKPVPWATRGRWVVLAFVPSSLLLGMTTHLTTDIASIPLLWVIPLSLYLLSFVIVFSRSPGWVRIAASWAMPGSWLLLIGTDLGPWSAMGLNLLFFFAAAIVLHGELARLRPPPTQLTEYYLWMSVGGMFGGLVNAILAPAILNGFYEYPAAVALAFLLVPSPWPSIDRRPLVRADLIFPAVLGLFAAIVYAISNSTSHSWVAAIVCACFIRRPIRFGAGVIVLSIASGVVIPNGCTVLEQSRNFFGVLTVMDRPNPNQSNIRTHILQHGTTEHGRQLLDENPLARLLPRSYYDLTGPIGQVFMTNGERKHFPPVAVIGLGTGALAGYAEKGQEFTFFEIDPAVVRVAENPQYFTYLSESRGKVRIELGDARLMVAREPAGRYGVIVVDAFSSDAIPVHLLTAEALDVYLDKLAPDGLIAFHISNRFLDLERVLAGHARTRGLHGLVQYDRMFSRADILREKQASDWVLLARTPDAFEGVNRIQIPGRGPLWRPLRDYPDSLVWTDNFSNLLTVFRFHEPK
ncbi:MAG TPA: fused MFS/spermidine synthase [Gemmata sp.]|jgi:hypothetical protein|nr:fused MFS/spermidine synthase [Gemmata sp.]